MLKFQRVLTKAFPANGGIRRIRPQRRYISALYMTGDKAKDNYAPLRPYMDFEGTFLQKDLLEQSIVERQLQVDLTGILEKYAKYRKASGALRKLEEEREAVALKLRELTKTGTATETECVQLKEHGKALRTNLKQLKDNFYPIENDFVHAYLDLPNFLHTNCPSAGTEKLLYRSTRLDNTERNVETHLKNTDLIRFMDNSRYYLMEEAAEFDINCTHALTSYFVDTGHFIQTSNPDFVRLVLLEANATPLTHYHMVKEEQLQNKINSAYLTGGAAFESFLGAVTKLCVYPSVLPLRYVSNGRLYHKAQASESSEMEPNLFTATQTNAVQTFVATVSASEADAQLDLILNMAVDFYSALGVHYRIVYAQAHQLTPSECLRASIEVYSPAQKRYVSVGHVSNYSDFVSKRILFSMRQQKNYHFLHIVGGPVLHTTRLIAALIEEGIPLDKCKLLGASEPESSPFKEFKNIFK